MTAEVFLTAFDRHEHNALEVAEQELQMARQHYDEVMRTFTGCDSRKVAAMRSARERWNLAWDALWRLKRGW